MLAAGTTLGPYKILAPLGAGGMGEVYRAHDPRFHRDVAIKVILTDVARDPERIKRFEQEARAAGALSHPNVCTVYDLGTHEGSPFVVMELLEGESLREKLNAGPLPVRKAIDYAGQAAHGLAAAHEKGIVHRDLKPENLFVTRDGRVKVLDFGLAKLTRPEVLAAGEQPISIAATETGTILGTVGYMAPEQVLGKAADARSDLFALGAVLYELLTGKRAFHRASYVETLHAILNEEPAPLASSGREIPAALEPIVRRCLEKSPAERFQSASDLAFALDSLSGASAAGTLPPARGPVARRRVAVLALCVLGLAAVTAATYVVGQRWAKPVVPSYKRVTFRRGTVGAARFTPDGQSVVYSARYVGERSNLFVQRLGTSDARPLELSGTVVGMSGGEMAIVHGDTLSRVSIEGGTPRDLAEGVGAYGFSEEGYGQADWSRDGSKFALVHLVNGVDQQLECPIGHVLYKTTGGAGIHSLRFSPAGDRVAYVWSPLRGLFPGQVEVVDLKGRRQVLSKGWESLLSLAWSPDGREVWFTGTRKGVTEALHAVTLKGRERVLLKVPGSLRLRDVAPDGRLLLTQVQSMWEVRGRMAGDSAERDYSWLDGTLGPNLTPDGKQMLTTEMGEGGGGTTYMRRNDGKPPVRLCEGWAGMQSRDGRWALIAVGPNSKRELRMVPTGAGEAYTLPLGPIVTMSRGGGLTEDGKHVIWAGAEAGGRDRLWVQELPAGLPRPFGPDSAQGWGWASTPDGRWWPCLPAGPRAPWQLYPIDGGEPRPLPWVRVDDVPIQWSDDGRWLYCFPPPVGHPQPQDVIRIDTRTGRRQPWLSVSPPDMAGVGASSIYFTGFTPDGRYYAYSYNRSLSDLYVVTGVR